MGSPKWRLPTTSNRERRQGASVVSAAATESGVSRRSSRSPDSGPAERRAGAAEPTDGSGGRTLSKRPRGSMGQTRDAAAVVDVFDAAVQGLVPKRRPADRGTELIDSGHECEPRRGDPPQLVPRPVGTVCRRRSGRLPRPGTGPCGLAARRGSSRADRADADRSRRPRPRSVLAGAGRAARGVQKTGRRTRRTGRRHAADGHPLALALLRSGEPLRRPGPRRRVDRAGRSGRGSRPAAAGIDRRRRRRASQQWHQRVRRGRTARPAARRAGLHRSPVRSQTPDDPRTAAATPNAARDRRRRCSAGDPDRSLAARPGPPAAANGAGRG